MCGLRVSFQPGVLQMGYCHFPHKPSPYHSLFLEGFPERMRTLVLVPLRLCMTLCTSLLLAEPGFPCPVRGETVASPAGVVRWKWCIAHAQRRGPSLLSFCQVLVFSVATSFRKSSPSPFFLYQKRILTACGPSVSS